MGAVEGIDPRFTPHDLRRPFVTMLNELGAGPTVIERLVNHSLSGCANSFGGNYNGLPASFLRYRSKRFTGAV